MFKQAFVQLGELFGSCPNDSRHQNMTGRKPPRKRSLRFEAMEDRCMLAVDSGIGVAVHEIGPQTQDNWIGQYVEPVVVETLQETNSFEVTWDQIDLAMDEMLDSEAVLSCEEAFPYYATVDTFEESHVYLALKQNIQDVYNEIHSLSVTASSSFDAYMVRGQYGSAMPKGIFGPIFSFQGSGNQAIFQAEFMFAPVPSISFTFADGSGSDSSGNSASDYWTVYNNTSDCDLVWTLPANISNATAKRQFIMHASKGGETLSIPLQIEYAEVLIDFAGAGNYRHVTTTGGQTAANTVIVGQKVSAKVESSLEIVSCGWDGPSGGNYVKNYITTDSVGQVVTHTTQDYYQEQFDFYYTGKGANQTTGIGAYMVLRDANGKTYNISDSVSYYLESPTVEKFDSAWTTLNPKFRKEEIDEKVYSTFGNSNNPGITWEYKVNETGYPDSMKGGLVFLIQTVNSVIEFSADKPLKPMDSEGDVLDKHVIYPGSIGLADGALLTTHDYPRTNLDDWMTGLSRYDSFKTHLMYFPPADSEGGSIPVALSLLTWQIGNHVDWVDEEWDIVGYCWGGNNAVLNNNLPTWNKNITTVIAEYNEYLSHL